jgi:hypothetical protein
LFLTPPALQSTCYQRGFYTSVTYHFYFTVVVYMYNLSTYRTVRICIYLYQVQLYQSIYLDLSDYLDLETDIYYYRYYYYHRYYYTYVPVCIS